MLPWMEFCSLWCWHQPVVSLLTCNVHWSAKVLSILSKTEVFRSSKPLNHLWAVWTDWNKDVGDSSSKGNKVALCHQRFVGFGQTHLVRTKAGWVMRWDVVGFLMKLLWNDLGSTLFPIFTFTFHIAKNMNCHAATLPCNTVQFLFLSCKWWYNIYVQSTWHSCSWYV